MEENFVDFRHFHPFRVLQLSYSNGPPAVKSVRLVEGAACFFRECEGNANGASVELTSVLVRL